MPSPEQIGEQISLTQLSVEELVERRNFKHIIGCGCLALGFMVILCPIAAKLGWDAVGGNKPIVTPDLRPKATETPYIISVPISTETSVPNNLCVTVSSGDYAFKIYQVLIDQGHNPKKSIIYYPIGGGGPFGINGSDQLPSVIQPGDIFCGQR